MVPPLALLLSRNVSLYPSQIPTFWRVHLLTQVRPQLETHFLLLWCPPLVPLLFLSFLIVGTSDSSVVDGAGTLAQMRPLLIWIIVNCYFPE